MVGPNTGCTFLRESQLLVEALGEANPRAQNKLPTLG